MKRMSLVFVMILLIVPNIVVARGTESDLNDVDGHWAAAVIQENYQAGLINGYTDGGFHPYQPIRKSEFIALINRFFGLVSTGEETFSDLTGQEWYAHHARIAAHNYLSDDVFNGTGMVTYTEAATILAELCSLNIVNLSWDRLAEQSAEVQEFLEPFSLAKTFAPYTLSRGGSVAILATLARQYAYEVADEFPMMDQGTRVVKVADKWQISSDQNDLSQAIGIFAIEDLLAINADGYDYDNNLSMYLDYVLMRNLDFNDPFSYRDAYALDEADIDRDADLSETLIHALSAKGEGHGFPPIGVYGRVTQQVDVMPDLSIYDPTDQTAYDYDRHLNGYVPNASYLTKKKLYRGDFDGNDRTIRNLYINANADYGSVGFFAIIKNGTVSNLNFVNADVTGYQNGTGVLAGGNVGGTVDNCHVYQSKVLNTGNYYLDDVSGGTVGGLLGLSTNTVRNSSAQADVMAYNGNEVGGLIGASGGASCEIPGRSVITIVENCSASGNVTGLSKVGGLVGNFVGQMNNCSYDGGTVTVRYAFGGGLVGMTKSTYTGHTTIDNSCSTDFAIVGASNTGSIGGLFGHAIKVDLNDCYVSDGQVTGGQAVGGFGGWAGNPYTGELGVAINRASADVAVNGEQYLGGFLGYTGLNTQINDAYSLGNVTILAAPAGQVPMAGGFIGHNDVGGWISQVYALGNVESEGDFSVTIGGLVGRNDGVIGNSVAFNPFLIGNGDVHQIAGTVGETGQLLSNYASIYISDGYQRMTTGTRFDQMGCELYPYRFTDRFFLIYNQNWSVPEGGYGWDMNNIWEVVPGASFPTLR